ncbi:MAG: lipid-A-disaccharide synthase [Thermodesulfovibrionales bacterium]|nr:lipid-A-disaccharide synthase [Thermodesulfovibrionales bacterium]
MLEKVMIISGESSGELYGALLASHLKELNPNIKIVGVGGAKMQASSVELISPISSAFGLTELLSAYRQIRITFKKVVHCLEVFQPDILILIDYPDFNLKVAKKAKKLNIKVLYYVSPQIWAWRPSRIKTIKRLVDKMVVVLPFEEELYRKAQIPCEFVGHPVLDEIELKYKKLGFTQQDISSGRLKQNLRLNYQKDPSKIMVTLMPGSREHELRNLLPIFEEVIFELSKTDNYFFIIPIAPNLSQKQVLLFDRIKRRFSDQCIFTDDSLESLMASDVAIIASGTATLQAALLGVPMVVIYKLSPLSYFLARLLVKIKHFSLVNVLLDYSIKDSKDIRVKELLQNEVNKNEIIKEILAIIENSEYRNSILNSLFKIKSLFINKNASRRVSEIAQQLCKK